MKKIIFVLAAAVLAVGVQGAAIDWKMGTSIKAPNADGSIGTSNAGAGTLSMYVWLVDQTTYDAATADSILAGYSGQLGTATTSITGKGGLMGGQARTDGLAFSTTADTPYYALVLTQYTSGETEMFIANKATVAINTAGTDATVANLAKNWGGGAGPAITAWVKAGGGGDIPEPTSGLLLLVGGAMLALRRRQR
mgnify:FL=1